MAGVTVTPYFTPTSITGCRLWLDAQDNSTISLTSGRVSTVTDKALNTTFTSVGPTPANLTVASASINSFQSFYFNNSAGNYAGLSGNLAQLTTGTAIFVMRYLSSQNGPWRGIFGWNDVKRNATLFRENDTKFLSLPCKNSEYIEDTIFKKVD